MSPANFSFFKRVVVILCLIYASISLIVAQIPNESIKKSLQNNAYSIKVDDWNNWAILTKELRGKRIVSLGEFTHGSKEVNLVRNNLIEWLIKEQGFDVILFETGMGEVLSAEIHKNEKSSRVITQYLMWPWWTNEFVELMDLVKEERVSIAGYDVQRSGRSFQKLLNDSIYSRYKIPAHFHDLEDKYSDFEQKRRKATYDSLAEEGNVLARQYSGFHKLLNEKISNPSSIQKLIKRTLINRSTYITYQLDFLKNRDYRAKWTARDLMMAGNVEWLMEHIYSNRKVIIIGHNFHIAKYNEKEAVMGEWLSRKFGKRVYEIGFFASEGEYADNFARPEKLEVPDSLNLDIKHIINALDSEISLIHIKKKHSWAREEITVNNSFTDLNSTNKLILRDHFKAIILIKKSSLPDRKLK